MQYNLVIYSFIYGLKRNVFILFLFVLTCHLYIIGQTEAKFERITRIDGLSHNIVSSIFQDRYGFMWFATKDGLNRFDGFTFKHFYNDPLNPNSIISGNISCIFQSRDGYLWFGSYSGGLERYDPFKDEFVHFVFNENDEQSIGSNYIRQIKEDNIGNLWIATIGGGLNLYELKTGKFKKYLYKNNSINSISSNDIYTLEIDSTGNIWIGTALNLDYFDVKTNQFTHFVIGYESFDQTKQLSVKTLFLDSKNKLWIGTSNGLYTYNKKNKGFYQYRHFLTDLSSISDNNINTIIEDTYGNIWIGTEGGLSMYVPEGDNFQNFYTDVNDVTSLSSNRILNLFEDRSNILWIGTKGGGINKLDLKRKMFYSIRYLPGKNFSLPHPGVNTIISDSAGNIWIGTDGGGICIFNRSKPGIEKLNQKLSGYNALSDDQILSLVLHRSKICVGLQTGGLNIIESINGRMYIKKFHKTIDSTGIANNQVNCLMHDKEGFLWIGTRDGLNKMIDTSTNGLIYFISYKNSFSDNNTISANEITTLYQDHKGHIWIGTNSGGINRLDAGSGFIYRYVSEATNSSALGSNSINIIFEDHLGVIWVGTSGGGLNKLNPDNKTFTRYTVKNGLPSNEIMAVLEDYSGFLWISTSKGLSKFDQASKKFTNFDIKDGLLNDGFIASSAFQDDSGWMYFGTNTGLVYFHPSQIQLNKHKPDIVISRFSFLKGSEWSGNDLFISKYNAEDNKIILDYDNNIFSVEFVAMDYTSPAENQFQYKIDGLNKSWIDYGNKRSLMVTNLEPGTYKLRIRGTNNDNLLNEEGLSLSIIVKPPFWKSNIFYFILLVLFVFIFFSIYSFLLKMRTNKLLSAKNFELEQANIRLIESEKSLKELNHTKDKFFSIIAHDLRNPFNPLLALTELLDNDYKDLSETERTGFIKEIRLGAKKLYDLLENLLNWALSQTKQINYNPKPLDINEIILNGIDLLSINAEKKGIKIQTNISGEAMVFADENMLNSIIRNLLNNAVKFSFENSIIRIDTFDEKEFLKVEVKDYGQGISAENVSSIFKVFSSQTISNSKGKGTGLGLILCKEFVEKNGGRIWAESELGKGSSFCFTIKKA